MRSLSVSASTLLLFASSAWAGPIDSKLSPFLASPIPDRWHMASVSCRDETLPAVPALSFTFPSALLQQDDTRPLQATAVEPSDASQTRKKVHKVWPSCGDEAVPAAPALLAAFPSSLFQQGGTQPLHAAAVEHSDAYLTRRKIHKFASFATLPLFATEVALGQSLYNPSANPGTKRALHGIVGAGIVGLFAVNTVTGAWNMFGEDRKDPQGRGLRLVHALLMMAADVGFVASSLSGPNSRSQRQALTFETSKVTHRNIAIASISVATTGYLIMLFGHH
jgi:hypothetical protein